LNLNLPYAPGGESISRQIHQTPSFVLSENVDELVNPAWARPGQIQLAESRFSKEDLPTFGPADEGGIRQRLIPDTSPGPARYNQKMADEISMLGNLPPLSQQIGVADTTNFKAWKPQRGDIFVVIRPK